MDASYVADAACVDPHPGPLLGTRVLSLALNLPGPAALMRLHQLGASCTKLEPPGGDPMQRYNPQAYAEMHVGVRMLKSDLKRVDGQQTLHQELAHTDVLLTSFRPSALLKLGLDWNSLHAAHPHLCVVTVVGAAGARAEEPGHDVTYMAEQDLVVGLELPPTLYADMGGALATSEAVLTCLWQRSRDPHQRGVGREVALCDAAAWLAQPRRWGLTQPTGDVGGAHAGYRVYACADGRVAVAALEPHFAQTLCRVAGLPEGTDMNDAATRGSLGAFFALHTRSTLDGWAVMHDLPLHTLPASS
jgi:crotonobetainyl-CoA:carnitine CoA-transferase CaiB-like acyl-CoA transferase